MKMFREREMCPPYHLVGWINVLRERQSHRLNIFLILSLCSRIHVETEYYLLTLITYGKPKLFFGGKRDPIINIDNALS